MSLQIFSLILYSSLLGAMVWMLFKIYKRLDEAKMLLDITKQYQELLRVQTARIPNIVKDTIQKEVNTIKESGSGVLVKDLSQQIR